MGHFPPPCMLCCHPKLNLLACLVRHPSLHAWLSPQTQLAYMLGEAKRPTFHPSLHACLVVTSTSLVCLHAWLGEMAHHFTPPCTLGCLPNLSFLACLVKCPSLHAWLSPQTLLPCMLGEAKLPTISPLLACLVVTPNTPCYHAY